MFSFARSAGGEDRGDEDKMTHHCDDDDHLLIFDVSIKR